MQLPVYKVIFNQAIFKLNFTGIFLFKQEKREDTKKYRVNKVHVKDMIVIL